MSEPFVGEIRMFAGNFAPRGWALCDGQLLAVSQNDSLFSLLGTIYGGDGRTTFGLPDLRGRVPIHAGSGPGLTNRSLGSKSGTETETLTVNQLPSHTHELQGTTNIGTQPNPGGYVLATNTSMKPYAVNETLDATLASQSISNLGGSQSHTNLQPFLCINFIIALFGIYPSRQ
ncbi:phage tail protein [Acaryochloris marina NIES-2412]|uniref:phage tail protein n=1 Tax=Acaryochloris marina TaxID=155978 RepID=UPI00405838E4